MLTSQLHSLQFLQGLSLMRKCVTALFVAWGIVLSTPAFSDTLIDTGAGSTEAVGSPVLFGPSDSGWFQYLAGEFTLSQAAKIETVSGWMDWSGGGGVQIKLYSDGGSTPGAELFSQDFNFPLAFPGPHWEIYSGLNNWDVAAGTYWIAFEPDPAINGVGFNSTMFQGAPSPLSGYAYSSNGSSGYVSAAGYSLGIRIEGTLAPVPEPEAYVLMLAGLLLVAGVARRRI